jgi:glycerol-3-phosphate acyltransferase PlsY
MILKVIATTLGVLAGAALVFGVIGLALWWLVPLAFPLLAFTYWQALALTGILAIVSVMVASKN